MPVGVFVVQHQCDVLDWFDSDAGDGLVAVALAGGQRYGIALLAWWVADNLSPRLLLWSVVTGSALVITLVFFA